MCVTTVTVTPVTLCSITDPFSVFNTTDGGRVNGEYKRKVELLYDGESELGFFCVLLELKNFVVNIVCL